MWLLFRCAWPDAVYTYINQKEACAPEEIRKKSICVEADIGAVLEKLYRPSPDIQALEPHQ